MKESKTAIEGYLTEDMTPIFYSTDGIPGSVFSFARSMHDDELTDLEDRPKDHRHTYVHYIESSLTEMRTEKHIVYDEETGYKKKDEDGNDILEEKEVKHYRRVPLYITQSGISICSNRQIRPHMEDGQEVLEFHSHHDISWKWLVIVCNDEIVW